MDFIGLLGQMCRHLSLLERGELVTAIISYTAGEEVSVQSPVVAYAFSNCKDVIDEDIQRRHKAAEKHRECGCKGGRPPKPSETKDNLIGFSETKENQIGYGRFCKEKEESADNIVMSLHKEEKENKKEIDNKLSIEKEKSKRRFTPPTVEEVAEYCSKRRNSINAEYFVAKYNAIGWVVGKNRTPMKDWKQVIRTWEIKNESDGNGGELTAASVPQNHTDNGRSKEYESSF